MTTTPPWPMSSVDSIRHGVEFHGPICMPSVSSAPLASCWIVVLRVRPLRLLGFW